MKPTQEMITIIGDGITVTARKYVDGELTCSARCLKKLDAAYNFDKQAVDAVYALRAKQIDHAVEYCKADADVTKQYYEYRKAHPDMFPEEQEDGGPECDEPDCDVQEETTKYPKIYQSVADCVEEAEIIYYEGRPEVFWKDFKGGSFIIKVSRDEWSELVASAESYGVTWASGEELGRLFPFKRTKDVVYVGKGIHRMYSPGILYCYDIAHISDFEKRNCIAWSDIKEALKTTETFTNYYEGRPEVFWENFKQGKFTIKVSCDEWAGLAASAKPYGLSWRTGDGLDVWTPPFGINGFDNLYIGITNSDFKSVAYCEEPINFKGGVCIAWEDIKEALKAADSSTNDVNDTSLPWDDVMSRRCVIRVRKQDWNKFAEQAATEGISWSTGVNFIADEHYPDDNLVAIYVGRIPQCQGLTWAINPEGFRLPELTVIHFSRWCDND